MGVKIGRQFNRPVVAKMDEQTGLFQILQIKLGSDGIKQIEGLHASYNSQQNIGAIPADAQTIIANTFIQGRILIAGEDVDIEDLPIANLQTFHPFNDQTGDLIINNILFDESFVNRIDIDFTLSALEIPDGTGCSILLSNGFAIGDTTAAQVVKIGFLNVLGQYKTTNPLSDFYSIPR